MQVRPTELARHLETKLEPVYLVSGDETLIVEESCDAIVARARRDGFSERTVLGEGSFEWSALAEAANSLSLFAERRVLDLRLPAKAFDKTAAQAIESYLDRATGDTLLLLRTERLEPRQRDGAWFSRIDEAGVVVLVWPVTGSELPRWLAARCRARGIELERAALEFLSESIEGNLLAAAQEIEKLCLLDLPQPISLEALRDAVLDASRFDAFDLIDAALAGDAARVHRVVDVLREVGAQPLAVLGLLASFVRRLATGQRFGMPPQRAKRFEAARARLDAGALETALDLAATIDWQVKGAALGDPWQTLETQCLLLAGAATWPRPAIRPNQTPPRA